MAKSERAIVSRILGELGLRGEDAAVIDEGGKKFALSTDCGFSSTHIPRNISFFDIGYRRAVASLSDIAGMGAHPLAFLLAIGAPKKMNEREIIQIVHGAKSACAKHKTKYAGGDTKQARELSLCGTALGILNHPPLLRSNAKPGDILATTGPIGDAFCGLDSLLHRKKADRKLLQAFLHPSAKFSQAQLVAKLAPSSACMDVSDGFLFTCATLARESGVKVEISRGSVPFSAEAREYARKNSIPFNQLADTGEDYQLVFSIPKPKFIRLHKRASLRAVGYVVKGSGLWLDGRRIEPRGYDAFIGLGAEK